MGEKEQKARRPKRKRQILAAEVVFIVIVAGIVGGVTVYANMPKGGILKVGGPFRLQYIDPLWAYNPIFFSDPHLTFDQITEGLFVYDLNSDDLEIIPNLATEWDWNDDATELMCYLRQGVVFYDGTPFTASAVKFTFDRLYTIIEKYGAYEDIIFSKIIVIIKKDF
jgi:ABC-type transport system substrate-binding protein